MIRFSKWGKFPEHYLHDHEVILYGAGKDSVRYLNNLKRLGANITAFCDTNKTGTHCGLPIISLEQLKQGMDNKYIVISSILFYDEIEQVLEDNDLHERLLEMDRKILMNLVTHCEKKSDTVYHFDTAGMNYTRSTDQHIYKVVQMLCEKSILVYQPGKVGSSTVRASLTKCNVSNEHLHNMNQIREVLGRKYNQFLSKIQEDGLKIITMVREPLARDFSAFFQGLHRRISDPDIKKAINFSDGVISYADIHDDFGCYFNRERLLDNDGFNWFDKQIKTVFDVDVYQYPFDQGKGYTIIKEGNIEILLMTLEKMNGLEAVIGEFIGVENFKLINKNEAKDKPYSKTYKRVKEEIQFPEKYVDYYYKDNPHVSHFYSKEDRNKFLAKWEKNLPQGYLEK